MRYRHLLIPLLLLATLPGLAQNPVGGYQRYPLNSVIGLRDSLTAIRASIGAPVSFSNLSGKPQFYPSSISLVQNLQNALNNKLGINEFATFQTFVIGLQSDIVQRPTLAEAQALFKPIGYAPTFTIGNVTSVPFGQPSTAAFSGTADAPVLSLTIAGGQPGAPGTANGGITQVNGVTATSGGAVNITATDIPVPAGGNVSAVLAAKSNIGDFGKSIRNTSADLTGGTDASAVLQTLVAGGGRVYLTGTIRLNNQVNLPSNTDLYGNATIIVGTGVAQVLAAESQNNISVSGLTFVRATGNTGDPISLLVRQCRNVRFENNVCTGVLGIQTYRPLYSTANAASLCYNVSVIKNQVYNVGFGPYGGAITLNFVNGAQVEGNIVDDCIHGIFWWGGDGNYENGENNITNTAPKWASNLVFNNNRITRCNKVAGNGGGLWGSMGQDITGSNNFIDLCGDVGLDVESSSRVRFSNSVVNRCTNSALSTFYGSRDVEFLGTTVFQRPQDGNIYHAYGNTPTVGVKILGGRLVSQSTGSEGIFSDDALLDGLVLGGGLELITTGRAIKLQKTNNVTVTAPFSITSAVENVGGAGANHAVYVQGGQNINLSGIDFTYSGFGAAGAIYMGDGSSGPVSNFRIENVRAPGYALGIRNDQFGGGTGGKYFNNQVEALNIASGSPLAENNRTATGVPVDTYLTKFATALSGITAGTGGFAPILTLPATSNGSYDYSNLIVSLGEYGGTAVKTFNIVTGNRGGFHYTSTITGLASAQGSIAAFQNPSGSVTLYVNLSTFGRATVTYLSLVQSVPVQGLVFATATPTGTPLTIPPPETTGGSGGGTGNMSTTVYDNNANGVADNTERFGGQLPAVYATKASTIYRADSPSWAGLVNTTVPAGETWYVLVATDEREPVGSEYRNKQWFMKDSTGTIDKLMVRREN